MNNNNWVLQLILISMLSIITIMATYLIVDNKTSNIADEVVIKIMESNSLKNNLWNNQPSVPEKNIARSNNDEATSTISIEKAKKITKEGTYIYWNPDAEITWIEYSDLECPFCKKLHKAWTIEEILKMYDGNVNFVFKQFPLDFHAMAQMEAEALLCVWDLAWSDKYYEFITKIFDNSQTNGRSFTKDSISELWTSIWIDKNSLFSCIESGKFKQKALDEMSEWQSFGIQWTPWNVLINNKTWKWDKLPWAYPTNSFKQKIDSLLQ